jgi:hypothetical protein
MFEQLDPRRLGGDGRHGLARSPSLESYSGTLPAGEPFRVCADCIDDVLLNEQRKGLELTMAINANQEQCPNQARWFPWYLSR